jgi:hypothetical protein
MRPAILGDCLIRRREFPRALSDGCHASSGFCLRFAPRRNSDCIRPHRVDLPMCAADPLGKNTEGRCREIATSGKADLLGNVSGI